MAGPWTDELISWGGKVWAPIPKELPFKSGDKVVIEWDEEKKVCSFKKA